MPNRSAPRIANAKPLGCSGCVLETSGLGYVPDCGPASAPILLVGEAPAYDEVAVGEPFVGAAGSMLSRILRRNGWAREQFRIDNTCRCVPPKMFLQGAPWQRDATEACRQYTDPVLSQHRIVVPMGKAAIERVLGLTGKHTGPESLHGTVHRRGDQLVVPTFHPSFLQRGATNLLGVVSFDLQRAHEIATSGWVEQPIELVCDPPIEWFERWATEVIVASQFDPGAVWLAVDIETPDKAGGRDEGDLTSEDQSYQIDRVNFACDPDQGVTVPYCAPYIEAIDRLLSCYVGVVCGWNFDYDEPRLRAAGHGISGQPLDFMWAWHVLQSDLPRGLGFVAPFYSKFGAWKHLSGSDPVRYACIDGPQTLRSAFGIAEDLQAAGQWDAFLRHVDQLDRRVLKPARVIGVKIDRPALLLFKEDLTVKSRRLLHSVQAHIPDQCRQLHPKAGYVRPPAEGLQHPKASGVTRKGTVKVGAGDPLKQELFAQRAVLVERTVVREILVCRTCGAREIHAKHRCEDKAAVAQVERATCEVTRWFWQEPFNPDSAPQILAVMLAKGHTPGKSKTSEQSTNRQSLEDNAARTKDPFYAELLKYRAVTKVRATYVIGTERRMDAEDRIHPQHTFKPSTLRLSYVAPNIQNVKSRDSGGDENLASGFRRCVVPGEERPVWLTDEDEAAWNQRYA